VRKSMSIPGVFPPVLQENEESNGDTDGSAPKSGARGGNVDVIVDGSVINNFPADIMADRPDCGTVIGISLVPAEDKVKPYRYGLALSGWSILWSRLFPWRRRGLRAPSLIGSILRTQEINSIIYLRANRKRVDLLIEPEVSDFSMSDYEAHDGLIAAGYEAARKALASWKGERTPTTETPAR
jgi:NTE family protein